MKTDTETQQSMSMVSDWPELVAEGPFIIGYLGQLMVVARKQDFTLSDSLPKDVKTLIMDPSSFRATLTQVSNFGYKSFYTAHKNVYGITLELQNLPIQMEELFNMVKHSPPKDVYTNSKESLTQIAKIADKCKNMSKEILTQFETTRDLIADVLTVSQSKKGLSEIILLEARANLTMSQTELDKINETSQWLQAENNATKQRVEESRKAYDEAIKAIPGSWEKLGIKLAEKLGEALCNVIQSANPMNKLGAASKLAGGISKGLGVGGAGNEGGSGGGGGAAGGGQSNSLTPQHIAQIKVVIEDCAEQLTAVAVAIESANDDTGNGTGNETGKADKGNSKAAEGGKVLEALMKAYKLNVDSASSAKKAQTEATNLLAKVTTIIEKLKKNPSVEQIPGLAKEMKGTSSEMFKMLKTLAAPAGEAQSTAATSPAKEDENPEQSKAELKFKELEANMQEKRFFTEKIIENQKQMGDILKFMAGLKLEELKLENITAILREGLKHLTVLQKHWKSLTVFFSHFHSIAENGMHSTIMKAIDAFNSSTFRNTESTDPIFNSTNYIVRSKYKTIMLSLGKFYGEAYHLQGLAYMYYNVSLTHLMQPMASLDMLLQKPASENDGALLNELYNNATRTSETIKDLVMKYQQKNNETVQMRLNELAALGGKKAAKRYIALL